MEGVRRSQGTWRYCLSGGSHAFRMRKRWKSGTERRFRRRTDGNAGNQAQKGGSGAEQTENVENGENAAENTQTSVIIAMPPTSEPEAGFDPAYGWGAGEHMHEPLIQSTLTVTEADLSIGYDLATDVETSEDGMTWTVTIRDDAKFTDGEALTAEDVAFTYNTLKKTSSVNDFSMLKQAEAIDDVTVVFEMELRSVPGDIS